MNGPTQLTKDNGPALARETGATLTQDGNLEFRSREGTRVAKPGQWISNPLDGNSTAWRITDKRP